MQAKHFELFMGCLGNGVTVCNKAVMESGDYKQIAHISPEGEVTWYVPNDYCPAEARGVILRAAEREKEKYQKWWNSLPPMERYGHELDRMKLRELTDHIHIEQERRKKSFQVITYIPGTGVREETAWAALAEAETEAQRYVEDEERPTTGALVYDRKDCRICAIYGAFPEDARPQERDQVCSSCFWHSRGCDGSFTRLWKGCRFKRELAL